MKILHLSDLHIGIKLYNRDMRQNQMVVFKQIADAARINKPNAIVIAGDIYDKSVPSAEAMETFDDLLDMLQDASPDSKIMVISGNHDSAPRVNTYRNILSKRGVYMIGNPPTNEEDHIEKVTLKDDYGEVDFYLLPFVKPAMIRSIVGDDDNGNMLSYSESVKRLIDREKVDTSRRNVLVSHQFYLPMGQSLSPEERADSEIVTVGNIDQVDSAVLDVFDYAALGHIHKPMKVGSEVYRYCGTPLAYSVSEAGQEKGALFVELKNKGDIEINVLPLIPERQVRIIKGEYSEVIKNKSDDYITVVLTDKEDLNVIDMQTRLRDCFPNLLEIRREYERSVTYDRINTEAKVFDPFELCCEFAVFTDEEKAIIQDVINTVKGAN